MPTTYPHNCTLATSPSNILTTSQSHHNRLMSCCLCLAMPRVSCLEHLNYIQCLVLSRPNLTCLGSSRVLTAVSWQISMSQKKCLDSVTSCTTRLITLSPTICQLPPSHDENRRFHRELGLAGIGLHRVRHVFFLLFNYIRPAT